MQGIIDRTSYEMSSTLDVLTHANGDGSQLPPVAHVGERTEMVRAMVVGWRQQLI